MVRLSSLFGWGGAVVVTASIGYAVMFSDWLGINRIECQADGGNCSTDILAELQKYKGKRSLWLRPRPIAAKIAKADLNIAAVEVKVKLPDSLLVNLTNRLPMAQIGVSAGETTVLTIDQAGVVLGQAELDQNLPVVFGELARSLAVGDEVGIEVIRALAIVSRVDRLFNWAKPATIEGNSLIMGEKLIFSLQTEPEAQIQTLQLLVNQVKIDEPAVKSIDLRFERPVITK